MGVRSSLASRAGYHAERLVLMPLEFLNPRRYMRHYSRVLRRQGLVMTGTPRFIASNARFDNPSLVTVGDRLVVSRYVVFLTHDYSITTALTAVGRTPSRDHALIQSIKVGDNVFIGMGAIIMPGASIGSNVIVGAGSVVRGDVPDDSIVIGNPAKVIGSVKARGESVASASRSREVVVDDD